MLAAVKKRWWTIPIAVVAIILIVIVYNFISDPVHDHSLKKRAKARDIDAMLELGLRYAEYASKSKKSEKKAIYWLYQTGFDGNPRGYYELSKLYFWKGDYFSTHQGYTYLQQAARDNYPPAQVDFALVYERGESIYIQSDTEALMWYYIAESNVKGIATQHIIRLEERMSYDQIYEALMKVSRQKEETEWRLEKYRRRTKG